MVAHPAGKTSGGSCNVGRDGGIAAEKLVLTSWTPPVGVGAGVGGTVVVGSW